MKALFILAIFGPLLVLSLRPSPTLFSNKKISRSSAANSSYSYDALFTLRFLFRNLLTSPHADSLAFSPLSIVTALSALSHAANGSTAEELYRVLNVFSPHQVSRRMQQFSAALNKSHERQHRALLAMANRLFAQKGFHVMEHFKKDLQSHYHRKLEEVDFENDAAGGEARVNEWVEEATRGHIPQLIPPGTLDQSTKLVLANAVFFKGEWETMFDTKSTQLGPFYLGPKSYVEVPFMHVESYFNYHNFEKLGFEMVELPYASAGEVSMFLVLPHQGITLATTAKRFRSRPFLISNKLHRMTHGKVTVQLPRFKVEEKMDLKAILKSMGLLKMFQEGEADLSGITGDRLLHVSEAFHQAAVEVDEKGTKASAASAMVVQGRSMSMDPVFRADRPFIFFIRHNPTGAILFMGAIRALPDHRQPNSTSPPQESPLEGRMSHVGDSRSPLSSPTVSSSLRASKGPAVTSPVATTLKQSGEGRGTAEEESVSSNAEEESEQQV